jgi:hypothetical protein
MSAEPHTNCVLKTHLGAVVHLRSSISGHETGELGGSNIRHLHVPAEAVFAVRYSTHVHRVHLCWVPPHSRSSPLYHWSMDVSSTMASVSCIRGFLPPDTRLPQPSLRNESNAYPSHAHPFSHYIELYPGSPNRHSRPRRTTSTLLSSPSWSQCSPRVLRRHHQRRPHCAMSRR